MKAEIDLRPILQFLRRLRSNNNRPWFESHRASYQEARSQFEDYIAALITEAARTEPLGGISPRDCIFRINRDLRFSKDKSPYKPYMSAYIAPGGRKSHRLGYYVHIEPGNHSMIGGGLHEPDPQQTANWRQSIDRNSSSFKKITSDKVFKKYFGQVAGEKLKTAPKGFPRDHPEVELLRLKQVTVARPLSDKDVLGPRFLDETLITFKAMKPFLKYLDALS